MSDIIFYIIAFVIIAGGVLAVTSRKIFRSAVFLLISLLGIASLYFFIDFEFIAAVQIVVYVGGIVVLLIFSIFLTHGSGADMPRPAPLRMVFSLLSVALGYALAMLFIREEVFVPSTLPAASLEVSSIGAQMLSTTEHGFVLPFELVSMLLLASMIGCIVIAIKIKLPPHPIVNDADEDAADHSLNQPLQTN